MTVLSVIALDESDVYVIKPGFAENVTKLTTFRADRNQIEVIDNNVFNTLPLQRIRLNSNRIFYIADGAFHRMNLKYLRLNDNKLTRINSTWFNGTAIKRLSLSHNQIRSLHTNTFSGLTDMEMLFLEFNKIHYMDYDTFTTQCQLMKLYLAGNSLTNLEFQIANRLGFVDVSFNLISAILLGNETTLSSVSIHPNPWACKCLKRFLNESIALNIKIRESDFLRISNDRGAPSCSNVETECDIDTIRANALQREYFKSNDYNNLGILEYRERDFPNMFFKIRYRSYHQRLCMSMLQ
ncbi:Leucine rich repeat [Popillia japonica]|uniref:Leucine rich repeat n=1 Tax=Popillia japonica TaxID=7064 RepID=A0AAW1MJ23_POPJA